MDIEIKANITNIKYQPLLCRKLKQYEYSKLINILTETGKINETSFVIEINNGDKYALSWWVSPKRTRSYPYARVYDTLNFAKRVTIIPIIKDEGKDGDRDFIQWDTISLMTLLNVNVILAYYNSAIPNNKYKNKITMQQFDIKHIINKIDELIEYQSDPLHWNIEQTSTIKEIADKALKAYERIAKEYDISMHSFDIARKRLSIISKSREQFINYSRQYAKNAQKRESKTIHAKENITGRKAKITISNYLGGLYHFTADEVEISNNTIYITEAKHTSKSNLPSFADIKDGLLKMILFSNLEKATINNKEYNIKPVLKLTTTKPPKPEPLKDKQKHKYNLLLQEIKQNNIELKLLLI